MSKSNCPPKKRMRSQIAGQTTISFMMSSKGDPAADKVMDGEGQFEIMETVYGSDGVDEDSGRGMSDRVQCVATTIYRELERMIPAYGEEVVKEIMPHVVSILESLDAAYKENEEREAELELCKDDNEQLMTQYEREKQHRKSAEQKLMSMEDIAEDDKRETSEKLEMLQSIVRSYELKAKNAQDHVSRLEEKESEMKREYTKLHERYTELLKKHMDHVEKSKMLMGLDRMLDPGMRKGMQLPALHHIGDSFHHADMGVHSPAMFLSMQGCMTSSHINFRDDHKDDGNALLHEFSDSQNTAQQRSDAAASDRANAGCPESGKAVSSGAKLPGTAAETSRRRAGNSVFDELLDTEMDGDLDDVTGAVVNPNEFSSSGMSKEVENLILENQELLATKNALNVVKDDLIAQLDELMSEQELLRDEVASMKAVKDKMNQRIVELEEEAKKCRETIETYKSKSPMEDEDDIPMAQRKRFTRVEMARVLMERNQYKERLMELQEAVRWTEMIRASREHPDIVHGTSGTGAGLGKKRSNLWNFNLFSPSGKAAKKNVRYSSSASSSQRRPGPASALRGSKSSQKPSGKSKGKQQKMSIKFLDEQPDDPQKDLLEGTGEQYRLVKARVKTEDGRMAAYGWSLPSKGSSVASIIPAIALQRVKGQMPVPVPVYCKPVTTTDSTMKLWCASSACFRDSFENVKRETESSSSVVWICATSQADGQSASIVSVVDAHNPAVSLNTLTIPAAHILCIAGVPGVETERFNFDDVEVVSQWDNTLCNSTCGDGSFEMGIKHVDCPASFTGVDVSPDENSSANELEALKQPTMWLGSQDGSIYIYSANDAANEKLCEVKLPDTVLSIHYIVNRVFVALANGCVAVFCRRSGGSWKISTYYNLCLGRPQHSVRCMCTVGQQAVWCGYRNKVHVINTKTLALQRTFDAQTRSESQVRQMVCLGDGVWLTMRLDSTLRLYHATTYQHLQDVDIEPYVSKMLGTGKLGFSFVRVTSLLAACNRLWIGTGNGVIICVPLSESTKQSLTCAKPVGGVYHTYTAIPATVEATSTSAAATAVNPTNGTENNLPYCYMAQAQLSFHGHKDAVKFFVTVPVTGGSIRENASSGGGDDARADSGSQQPKPTTLIVSGGEGYVDFRVGSNNTGVLEEEMDESVDGSQKVDNMSKVEYSQLIVWEVYS